MNVDGIMNSERLIVTKSFVEVLIATKKHRLFLLGLQLQKKVYFCRLILKFEDYVRSFRKSSIHHC